MLKKPKLSIARSLVIAVVLSLGAMPGAVAEESTDDWRFDLTVWGWLPRIDSDVRLDLPDPDDEIVIEAEASIADRVPSAMVTFAASRGPWSVIADVFRLDEEATKKQHFAVGPGLDVRSSVDLEAWIVNLAGVREFSRVDESVLGIVFGARVFSLDYLLAVSGEGALEFDYFTRASNAFWNFFVGVRGVIAFTDNWRMPFYLDLGSGDADFTWQALMGVEYDFRWGGVVLAYRYLEYDLEEGPALRSLGVSGATLAMKFHF